MTEVKVHVSSLDEMGRRFAGAAHALERGETVDPEHLTFLSLEALMSVISTKRFALLKHLRAAGPMSVRRLASELGRDYKTVHGDVALLADSGLVARPTKDQVAVTWSKVIAELDLAA